MTASKYLSKVKSLPDIIEHHCTLFYYSQKQDTEQVTLGKLAESEPSWLHEPDIKRIKEQDSQKPLWQPVKYTISSDLYPHVQSLLESSDKQAVVWQPTEQLSRMLQGTRLAYPRETSKEERRPMQLELILPKASKQRLEAIETGSSQRKLIITIEKVRLHQLASTSSTVTLELSFLVDGKKLRNPTWLIEAIYHVSRFNQCRWISPLTGDSTSTRFSLGEFIRSILGEQSKGERRVFSSTMVRFDQLINPTAKQELAKRLSSHYNTDYHISEGINNKMMVDFENVTHLAELEGVATVVDHDTSHTSNFLEKYYTTAFLPAYQAITLLSFHEYQTLLHLNIEIQKLYNPADKEHRQAAAFKRFLDRTLQFRLRFQHPLVSEITMHNQYYDQLRTNFRIDALLQKLTHDSRDMSSFIQEYHQSASEYRMRWFNSVAAFGITFLTVFSIIQEVMEIGHWFHEWAGGISLATGTIFGLAAGIQQYFLNHIKNPHFKREAFDEIVKHKTLK